MTSPCSVILIAPWTAPYGSARIAVGGRTAATADGAAPTVEERAGRLRGGWRRRAASASPGGSPTATCGAADLVRVGVAEHHLLDGRPEGDEAPVGRHRQQSVEDLLGARAARRSSRAAARSRAGRRRRTGRRGRRRRRAPRRRARRRRRRSSTRCSSRWRRSPSRSTASRITSNTPRTVASAVLEHRCRAGRAAALGQRVARQAPVASGRGWSAYAGLAGQPVQQRADQRGGGPPASSRMSIVAIVKPKAPRPAGTGRAGRGRCARPGWRAATGAGRAGRRPARRSSVARTLVVATVAARAARASPRAPAGRAPRR